MTDWASVATQAAAAAEGVVGTAWGQAAASAKTQIDAMAGLAVQVEQACAAVPPQLTRDEYDSMTGIQKDELQSALSAYQAIGALAAEQAAEAAWNVFETALKAAVGFP